MFTIFIDKIVSSLIDLSSSCFIRSKLTLSLSIKRKQPVMLEYSQTK